MSIDKLCLFTGNANPQLAAAIARCLRVTLGKSKVKPFPDGEISVEIQQNVRGTDAFIIQPTCPPVNDNLIELLLMIDAIRRASARQITAVIPYYGYARQDRKVKPRVPISAKLVANLITTAGADRILVMDLHVGQIQGFFDIPVDHLYAAPVLIDYFKRKKIPELVVVAPDPGAVERAAAFAKRLEASLAIVDKRRPRPGVAKVMSVVGKIKNKNVILLDDMVDTGGSVAKAAKVLKEKGALDIYIGCTHAVLSGDAVKNLEKSNAKEIVVTNTIPLNDSKKRSKFVVLSVASLLAEAIKRIHNETSVSSLFV